MKKTLSTLAIGSALVILGLLFSLFIIHAGNESREKHKVNLERKHKTTQEILSDFNGKTIVGVKPWKNNRHITFVFTDSTYLTIKSYKYSMKIVSK
jgi:hypothetical protein